MKKKQSSTPSSTTSDLSDDPDAEKALKGFDFLAGQDDLDGLPEPGTGEWVGNSSMKSLFLYHEEVK